MKRDMNLSETITAMLLCITHKLPSTILWPPMQMIKIMKS